MFQHAVDRPRFPGAHLRGDQRRDGGDVPPRRPSYRPVTSLLSPRSRSAPVPALPLYISACMIRMPLWGALTADHYIVDTAQFRSALVRPKKEHAMGDPLSLESSPHMHDRFRGILS